MFRSVLRWIAPRPFATTACVALLVLLTAAAAWLWAHEGHQPLPSKGAQVDVAKGQVTLSRAAREALDVQTAEVEQRSLAETVLAYATLEAPWQRHAYVTTRLPGRIVQLYAKPGQTVAAGQALAEVSSLELENLALEIVNAQHELKLSAKIVDSLEAGSQRGAVREQHLLEEQTKQQQNVNNLDVARRKWLSLGLTPAQVDQVLRQGCPQAIPSLPILSRIPGVVIHADVAVGKVIEPTEHLFEIVDLSTVWVKIGVLEKDLYKIEVGQPVELHLAAYPGEVFRCAVQVKGQYLDPQTHLATVWAELSNDPGQEPRLLPGMYGQAQLLVTATNKGVVVPAAALLRDGAEQYVLVEESAATAGSQYQKHPVVVGWQTPDFVGIRAGRVFPGDRVVTAGARELASFFIQGVLRLSPEAQRTIGLRVEPARRQVVEDVVELDGIVDLPPDRRTVASSQLAGTLQRLHIERGQVVRAGEILAEVASLELHNLQAELLQAHLKTLLLQESLRRLRGLDPALTRRQIWDAETLLNVIRNRRDSLRRRLETLGLSAEQVNTLLTEKTFVEALPLRAPRDGTVVHFDKVLGQVIKAEEPLFEIHDRSQIWVLGYLSERDLARVRIGQRARIRFIANPSLIAEGTVIRSGRVFGSENRTLSVWVELEQQAPAELLHNMLARLSLTERRPQSTLAVPLGAVVRDGLQDYLFVQNADGTLERRAVAIGRADDRQVEITHGLQEGEHVAVHGAAELQTAYAALR